MKHLMQKHTPNALIYHTPYIVHHILSYTIQHTPYNMYADTIPPLPSPNIRNGFPLEIHPVTIELPPGNLQVT
ncbi:hypothetical protein EON63_05120 [archaeon]|nr:MAG: hypothetical protein EON63_05120 [archaeon]